MLVYPPNPKVVAIIDGVIATALNSIYYLTFPTIVIVVNI